MIVTCVNIAFFMSYWVEMEAEWCYNNVRQAVTACIAPENRGKG